MSPQHLEMESLFETRLDVSTDADWKLFKEDVNDLIAQVSSLNSELRVTVHPHPYHIPVCIVNVSQYMVIEPK